ncbi:hypothetical protein lerEdw1_009943 [Lerista edwardsae]|nr:hypothetical protein lerEdw1_009943 [Lerista edwardsae]
MASAKCFLHKGILFPVMESYSAEHLNFVENEFQLRDDDVLGVVYPKSGTNWLAEILSLIRSNGDPTWVRSVILFDRMPWIEDAMTKEIVMNYAPPSLALMSTSPLVIFHLDHCFVLPEYYGSWFDHVKGWLAMKDKPNFFLTTYEELQQDLRGSVERICQFLGKELTSQQIDSVVENASFETMKDNAMSNMSQLPDQMMDHSKGKLMRKGKSGTWKNELTVAQNELFDRVYREKMRDVTVSFPWD